MPYEPRAVQHRLLVAVDVQGYGARNDLGQHLVQEQLSQILGEAAKRSRLSREDWVIQATGDGELAILPLDVDGTTGPTLIDDYTRAIAASLRRANAERRDETRLRLRMAIHYGVVAIANLGFSGQGAVEVSRLVDSAALRGLLAGPADLVVMLSDILYSAVIKQGHADLAPEDFVTVEVVNKELRQRAYVFAPFLKPPWLPGEGTSLDGPGLAQLLSHLYPDNPPDRGDQQYEALAKELRAFKYETIGAVRTLLLSHFEEGKKSAERYPPLEPAGAPHTNLGIARLTIAAGDPYFRQINYGNALDGDG